MAGVAASALVFLAETSTPITLTPLRARAPRGQRAVGRAPRGKRPHIAWLAPLTPAGLGESRVVAGTVDGRGFAFFLERVLAPSLRPGQVVVWDPLTVPKSARALIEAAGCQVVCLPSSSPDVTPIAQTFAKAKQALRRRGARSWETGAAAIAAIVPTVTAPDARAFFAAAGFPRP